MGQESRDGLAWCPCLKVCNKVSAVVSSEGSTEGLVLPDSLTWLVVGLCFWWVVRLRASVPWWLVAKASLIFLPHRPLCRAAPNTAAGFPQGKQGMACERNGIHKPNVRVISHFCSILFIRSESISAAHLQGSRGLTLRHVYQQLEILGAISQAA